MAFLAPLAAMAGEAALPAIEGIVGTEASKVLTPLATEGLKKVQKSGLIEKGLSKLGNSLFGKHSKTARKLMKKGSSVAGVAFNPKTQNLINKGLGVAQGLGVLNESQASNIKDGYSKALSLHDRLSQFNKKDDPLKPKFDPPSEPTYDKIEAPDNSLRSNLESSKSQMSDDKLKNLLKDVLRDTVGI